MLCELLLPHMDLQYKLGMRLRLTGNVRSVHCRRIQPRYIQQHSSPSVCSGQTAMLIPASYHPFFCQQLSSELHAFSLVQSTAAVQTMAFVITIGLPLSILQSEASFGSRLWDLNAFVCIFGHPAMAVLAHIITCPLATATLCDGSHFQPVQTRMAQRRYVSHQWCPDRLWIF